MVFERNPWLRSGTIEIVYADSRLEAACLSERAAKRRWGPLARTVIVRVALLRAAAAMADLTNAPGRFHALVGNRRGTYALRVSANLRLVFEPHGEVPRKPDGGVDLAHVIAARILEVTDYHDE